MKATFTGCEEVAEALGTFNLMFELSFRGRSTEVAIVPRSVEGVLRDFCLRVIDWLDPQGPKETDRAISCFRRMSFDLSLYDPKRPFFGCLKAGDPLKDEAHERFFVTRQGLISSQRFWPGSNGYFAAAPAKMAKEGARLGLVNGAKALVKMAKAYSLLKRPEPPSQEDRAKLERELAFGQLFKARKWRKAGKED